MKPAARFGRAGAWVLKKICLGLIVFYRQCVSPHFPSRCRFTPTCSRYAYEAIERHGVLIGCFLSLKRLLRCNPFFKGGYDPVPENQ